MVTELFNPSVLGQLLLMQSYIINLPNKESIFSFVCKGLLDIPGIAHVSYLEQINENVQTKNPEVRFKIVLGNSSFGELVVSLSAVDLYKPYEDYLKNFIFMIGVVLEERNQRQINEQHKLLLNQRILERTQELTLEKENLIESQRRFTDLMKNINLLSVMLDIKGNIIFCNNYILHITKYTYEEVIGKNWFNLFLDEQNVDQIKSVFKRIIAGDEFLYNYENEITTKIGDKLLISWNNTLLRDANRNIVGTASIGENITVRKQAEEQLVKKNNEYKLLNDEYYSLNEELKESLNDLQNLYAQLEISKSKAEESDRLKTAFLENLSHEIRTPMNAIMGFSEILIEQYNNKPKLEKFCGIINRRCNDLLDIINDILDIAKIESGQVSITIEECNLDTLFEELNTFFQAYQNRLGKQHIAFGLKVHCNCKTNVIFTDKVKLRQIFINLISNSFKFTNTGFIEGGCTFDSKKNMIFFVRDSGIGIPADMQEKIFDRFFQVENDKIQNIGGTGLGLSIVRGMIEILGGELFLESEPDNGSKFSFTIPYKASLPVTDNQ